MKNLKENEHLVYHYSNKPFDTFDKTKCDGFWFTDIDPKNSEMLNEIGANDIAYVAECIITINNELLEDFNNYNCFESLEKNGCDGVEQVVQHFTTLKKK